MREELDRLESLLDKQTDGCWLWKGYVHPKGRGYVVIRGKRWQVSRLAYTVFVGIIPDGQCVLHTCDEPRCCRPDHLFLGCQEDNLHDMCAKGRHWRAKATTCRRGHPYTSDNVRFYPSSPNKRKCRTCERLRGKLPPIHIPS